VEFSLARFYIDTSDEQHFVRDDVGRLYDDVEAARSAAVDALPDMAREKLPDGDHHTFLALVRDEHGHTVMQAILTLSVVWLVADRTLVG
jgi:hypothetical protein